MESLYNLREKSALNRELLIKLYRTMLKIRLFEEKIIKVYPIQDMKCPVHLCIGQEAVAAGVIANLKKEDYIFSTHRNHGHCIAKGSDMKLMMAEFYGRKTGYCKGKGGSMHMVDPENGILGTSAIVGGGIPLAVGTALASAMKKDGRVSVSFFGDGACDGGAFHESLSFASLKKLPVVFVCENNFYATNSHISARQPDAEIADRAASYGIPSVSVDGNDVVGVYDVARQSVERARVKEGPSFIECRTYRWRAHVGPEYDYEKGCRPREELESWMEKCPVGNFEEFLLREGHLTEEGAERMKEAISKEINEAQEFGISSPEPGEEELFKDVYWGD